MMARSFESMAIPQPRAPPDLIKKLDAACATEWRPEEAAAIGAAVVDRMRRGCLAGANSLHSRADLANIAWCETCRTDLVAALGASQDPLVAPLRNALVGVHPLIQRREGRILLTSQASVSPVAGIILPVSGILFGVIFIGRLRFRGKHSSKTDENEQGV